MLERFEDTAEKQSGGKEPNTTRAESDNDNNNNVLACILSAHYVTQD